jgi:S1-C subfamily serine protease
MASTEKCRLCSPENLARQAGGERSERTLKGNLHMRMALAAIAVPLAALVAGIPCARAAGTTAGSGVAIGTQGEILTNSHVVENCEKITVQLSSSSSETAVLVARDPKNDLAVIRTNNAAAAIAAFREGTQIRAGDTVVALGYPLSGLLASSANLSVGNVSALAGLGDDWRYVQISAPVQPGNSGGPLLDASGHLVGIVTAKLNAAQVARFTGDIPQNVNFAIKAEVARTFLEGKGIAYRTARSDQQLAPADVGDIARPFTVHIRCQQTKSASATGIAPPKPSTPSYNGPAPSAPPPQSGGNAHELFKRGEAAFAARKLSEALRWFRQAADTGHSDAMNKIGIMYAMGQGVEADHAMAMGWFRQAADMGNPYAMGNIGELYAKGDGVAKDCGAARQWVAKAAAAGLENAKQYLRSGFDGLCQW